MIMVYIDYDCMMMVVITKLFSLGIPYIAKAMFVNTCLQWFAPRCKIEVRPLLEECTFVILQSVGVGPFFLSRG